MTREICAFRFYGEVIAKGRPRARTFRVGEQTRAQIYTPARTSSFEGKVRAIAKAAMASAAMQPTPDAVRVELAMDRAMPKGWSKAKQLQMRGEPVTVGNDIDNTTKAVLDALNGVVWEDDRQVSDLAVSRRWADEHGFCIRVSLADGPGVLAEVL